MRSDQPEGWESRALDPGKKWLKGHPNADRPHDYWSEFRTDLRRAFSNLCGYTALFTLEGTVDHFKAWETLRGKTDEWRAYDWENLRFAMAWINSARKSTPVPDPFEVEDSWFVLRLPSLHMEATDCVPPEQRERVENILRWLRDDPRAVDQRAELLSMYTDKIAPLPFENLKAMAPLIAAALLRQPEFLTPADRARLKAGTL